MTILSSFKRRTLLTASASLFGGLAGCAGVLDQSPQRESQRPPPLFEILIWNTYDNPKDVTLVVERNSQIVHWGTHKVPVKADTAPHDLDALDIDDKGWMGCGTYQISARVEDEPVWETVDFRNLKPSTSINGEFQPVELNIECSPKEMEMNTTRLDEPLFSCAKDNTKTKGSGE